MSVDPEKYLLPLDDGLSMRESQPYAEGKLYALEAYLKIAQIAMKKQKWRASNYIDLQAGPGKNLIENDIYLGSPLISLGVKPPFTHYWFNELDATHFKSLSTRIETHPSRSSIHLINQDLNDAVDVVTEDIRAMDSDPTYSDKWSTFNIAFLDPEGLELKWDTVKKLASINIMDLIINFCISGIRRNMRHQPSSINQYFGNNDWPSSISSGTKVQQRQRLINFYRTQLEKYGYHIITDDALDSHDIAVRNSRNAEVYSLIFASKNPLGDKFWKQVKTEVETIRHRSRPLL